MHRLHSFAGLIAGLVLSVIALSGTLLAIDNGLSTLAAPAMSRALTVADLASKVAAALPGVSELARQPDGTLIASYSTDKGSGTVVIDPADGHPLGPYRVSALMREIVDFHRSLFLGDRGRIGTAAASFLMLALCATGLVLLKRRAGGWRRVFLPVRGSGVSILHGTLGQIAILGLVISSLTGLWLSAASMGLLPDPTLPALAQASEGPRLPVSAIPALRTTRVGDLKKLTFPTPDDPTDIFDLRTTTGEQIIDPVSGRVLTAVRASLTDRMSDFFKTLHTGRGLAAIGMLLGLAAATVPVFTGTGALIWLGRRLRSPRIAANAPVKKAHIVILVGSEGHATWGFARTLHRTLTAAGAKVHAAAMNDVTETHLSAQLVFILTSTAGDGQAPASATAFLSRVDRLDGRPPVVVLGFGDKTFDRFCGFASTVEQKLRQLGWHVVMPLTRIDRQSSQAFAQWGVAVSNLLNADIVLDHVAKPPRTRAYELVSRDIFGLATGAPIAVLRFKPARGRFGPSSLPRFSPGDLIGILPPQRMFRGQGDLGSGPARPSVEAANAPGHGASPSPRFYSLATDRAHGFLEICVRLHAQGLCSGYLHDLEPGDRIQAFIRANPAFRPRVGQSPVILIGAGTGIAALAGLIRSNVTRRPFHLYWGGRRPDDDFLYRDELIGHMRDHRLATLRTAFSRVQPGAAYVQDRIEADGDRLRHLLHDGAHVVVCGGRDMAHAVAGTLDHVMRPLGLTTEQLKSAGRYVEDVY